MSQNEIAGQIGLAFNSVDVCWIEKNPSFVGVLSTQLRGSSAPLLDQAVGGWKQPDGSRIERDNLPDCIENGICLCKGAENPLAFDLDAAKILRETNAST